MRERIKNYLKNVQENENKGFSLVELIIVMAIMAILVGIVASQVLPYMEKSRQSKDQQQLSSLATDMVSAISQAETSVANFGSLDGTTSTLSDMDSATDQAWQKQLQQLRSSDGSGDSVTCTTIEKAIVGKFKSKKATDGTNGKKVYVTYKDGVVYVWTGAAAFASAPEKLRVESE